MKGEGRMSVRRGSAGRNTRSHRRKRTTRRLPRTSKLDHLRWLLLRWSRWVLWRCVSRVPRVSIPRVYVPRFPSVPVPQWLLSLPTLTFPFTLLLNLPIPLIPLLPRHSQLLLYPPNLDLIALP